MEKMLPYQALMSTKGLTKAELPSNIQSKIKKVEATLRSVASFGKKDENGDYVITPNVKSKLDQLDEQIVNDIWDYLESKQKEELRTPPQNEVKEEVVEKKVATESPKVESTPTMETTETTTTQTTTTTTKQESKGKIGFFDF
jgi:hypothetical protein